MYFDLDIPTVGASALERRELKKIVLEFIDTMTTLVHPSIDLAWSPIPPNRNTVSIPTDG